MLEDGERTMFCPYVASLPLNNGCCWGRRILRWVGAGSGSGGGVGGVTVIGTPCC